MTTRLPGELRGRDAAALAAVIHLHHRDGRATVDGVAALIDRSFSRAHAALIELRELGLVDWVDGTRGTIRPRVAIVAVAR